MSLLIQTESVPLSTDADGVVRVGGTRVPLETVIGAFQDGASAEEIASRYDALKLADIYAAIGYYLRHADEVDDYIAEREREAAQVRHRVLGGKDNQGFRKRLLARRSKGT